jgi:hypothetical protein
MRDEPRAIGRSLSPADAVKVDEGEGEPVNDP